jgi:hypothetical protein
MELIDRMKLSSLGCVIDAPCQPANAVPASWQASPQLLAAEAGGAGGVVDAGPGVDVTGGFGGVCGVRASQAANSAAQASHPRLARLRR